MRNLQQSEGYKEVVRPFLEARRDQSFPDPQKFLKEEEFVYAAKVTSVFKKVVAELIGWIDSQAEAATKLEEKAKGKTEDKFSLN